MPAWKRLFRFGQENEEPLKSERGAGSTEFTGPARQ
ncbi:hypothetical protein LEMLEM_LOCUS16973 [Lemmus lemmus]